MILMIYITVSVKKNNRIIILNDISTINLNMKQIN